MHQDISTDAHISLSITKEDDTAQLQSDINILYSRSLNNQMKFHLDICKVLTIKHRPSSLAMLPFVA